MSAIRQITVLGAGTMGHGIAHAAVAAGYHACVYDVSDAQLARAREHVQAIVDQSARWRPNTAAPLPLSARLG